MDAFDQRCIVEAKCKKEDLSLLSAALKVCAKESEGKSAGTEWEIDGERGNRDGNNEN